MTRLVAALAAVALTVSAAQAGPPCHGVKLQSAPSYSTPSYSAPAYAAPAYHAPTYAQVQYVYQPIATVVVPGNPTAVLNVYPGTTVFVQQAPPVNVTVTVDGKTGQAKVEEKK